MPEPQAKQCYKCNYLDLDGQETNTQSPVTGITSSLTGNFDSKNMLIILKLIYKCLYRHCKKKFLLMFGDHHSTIIRTL